MNQQIDFIEPEVVEKRIIHIQDDPSGALKRIRIMDDFDTTYSANSIACVVCNNIPDLITVIVEAMKKLYLVEKEISNHGCFNPEKGFRREGFTYTHPTLIRESR